MNLIYPSSSWKLPDIYIYTHILQFQKLQLLFSRNTMLHIRSWKYRTIFSEMRYIYLSLVSFSLWEERSIYSLYVSLLYIERLNHSLCRSVDARERSERAYQSTPPSKPYRETPLQTCSYSYEYLYSRHVLKYNWKNLHIHWFLKLYVKKHAFLEPEFIHKEHAFS